MKLQLVTKPLNSLTADTVVLPVFEEQGTSAVVPKNEAFTHFFKANPKFGKLNETQSLFLKDQNYLLIGLGKKEKFNSPQGPAFAKLQNWAGVAVKQSLTKSKSLSIVLPQLESLNAEQIGQAIALGTEIAEYDPVRQFKSESEKLTLTAVELVVERAERGFQEGIKKGQIIATSINYARNLSDLPANIMTPNYFLEEVKKVAKECKLKLTVLTESQARRKGMGAFALVASGSDEPSYMIALEYSGNLRDKTKWAFVGKGITFDSGGLYAKPSPHMNEMKYDMCGAANVLAAIKIAAKLGLRANLVAVMAVTENMINGKAMKPGDIVKSYCGKTVEIGHTDAEGRVVLLDAVAFAQKDFGASKIIDLATLTGSVISTLGTHFTGVFSNNANFEKELINAGERVGEKFWGFPMGEEFNEMIKGEFADIMNVGKPDREAGSIAGAKFIEEGIEGKNSWIHLDIAGTAWDSKPKSFRAIGATGVGIKTLIEMLNG